MSLSVAGPSKDQLTLHPSDNRLVGTFKVILNTALPAPCYVLYRLRVKEASILFSKIYGFLGRDASNSPHPSYQDTISIYASPSVAIAGKLSTIRVEYVHLSHEEASEVMKHKEHEKPVCKPFFQRGGVQTYDFGCVVSDSPAHRYVVPAYPEAAAAKYKFNEGRSSHLTRVVSIAAVVVGIATATVFVLRRARQLQ